MSHRRVIEVRAHESMICCGGRQGPIARTRRPDRLELTGACNSEQMLGHQYSGSGGQLDFVRGAYASKGGKAIIASKSTAGGGRVSRIVPKLDGPVTTPRIDTHWIVTEFGAVNLKGLSSTERANALIGLAHPDFRDQLREAARAQHLV
jgi:itaconate CoA-transferase